MTPNEVKAALAKPFAPEDLEWRLQMAFENEMRGIAVPYVTNRAIQNRLDDVAGPENWYNEYRPWHGTGKKEAQICGISIYFEGRGFITKWDGAEDSDIEPVKGGLSDSMKRAAVQWGIGRILYEMDTVYVNIEKKGRSFIIKPAERARLDKAYLDMLRKKSLTPAPPCGLQAELVPRREKPGSQEKPGPKAEEKQPPAGHVLNIKDFQKNAEQPAWEYTVANAKIQKGMNGVSTSLVLTDTENRKLLAFVRGSHNELQPGVRICNVRKTLKKQDSVAFYILDSLEIFNENAA